MSLVATFLLLASFAGGLALIALGLRQRRASRLALADAERLSAALLPTPTAEDTADILSARLAELLGEHERRLSEAFATVREDVSGLKSDVEWLTGERMIEQAIALAQTGSDPDEIGHELGLSRDAAATIALFRKH